MSGKIIFTLLKKDLKGCLTNKNILVSFLIPIVFCFIYQNVFSDLGDEVGDYVLGMCAVFSIAISPTSILPVMIAEEKEKYTLRSLMMARVRGQEFLASKLLVCLLMTLLDAAAVFFITGGDMKDFRSTQGLCCWLQRACASWGRWRDFWPGTRRRRGPSGRPSCC